MTADLSSLHKDIKELTAGLAALKAAIETGITPVYGGRTLKRSDVCRLLAVCSKTLCRYYDTYRLPIPDPRDRKSRYSYAEVAAAAEILKEHGKLKRGSLLNF